LAKFAIICVGASRGGVEALQTVTSGLPPDILAAIIVVQHVGRNSWLTEILSRSGSLPATHPHQGERILPGRIYVAPPDHHLLVQLGFLRLARGPHENWSRPAIDPMLRSAARSYGKRAVGVILTGLLNDGTAGLQAIRSAGGLAIVQDPADAFAPGMPRSALRHAGADFCVPIGEMARVLVRATDLVCGNELGAMARKSEP
jgi:two-component system, chemotaxis family, protein-glutamate methylesterase/glutaminase